jgi:hypothetical protein
MLGFIFSKHSERLKVYLLRFDSGVIVMWTSVQHGPPSKVHRTALPYPFEIQTMNSS